MEYLQEETRLLATPTILPAHLSKWKCLEHDTQEITCFHSDTTFIQ